MPELRENDVENPEKFSTVCGKPGGKTNVLYCKIAQFDLVLQKKAGNYPKTLWKTTLTMWETAKIINMHLILKGVHQNDKL